MTMGADDMREVGPNGLPFPSEAEWLDLPAPPEGELAIAADFVARTLQALANDRRPADGADEQPEPLLTADRLRAFAAPAVSPSFVDDTLQALRRDRTARWRELLSRHIAPEPSPQFVARTLAALAADRSPTSHGAGGNGVGRVHRWRFAVWPLLAAAAAAMVWLLLRDTQRPPIELRFARQDSAAFAHAYAATPLAAVLDARDRARDPYALAQGGPDGTWLLLAAATPEGGR